MKQKPRQSSTLISLSMVVTIAAGFWLISPRPQAPISEAPTLPYAESLESIIATTSSTSDQPSAAHEAVATTASQNTVPTKTSLIDGKYPIYPYKALGETSSLATPWYPSIIKSSIGQNAQNASGRTVAVIDTGFALSHISLASSWQTNSGEIGATTSEGAAPNCSSRGLNLNKSCNNLDDDNNGYADDWRGWDFVSDDNSPQAGTTTPSASSVYHGTFVAGLIGANESNGIAGIAQGVKILPLQALADNGNGDTLTVGMAIRYAADQGVDVINLSLGSEFNDEYLKQQVDYALSKGVVIVAAAGNDGCNCMLYPANYPEVVGVGASTQTDGLAQFSSFGPNLDLVAPGVAMCSTTWSSANQTSSQACGPQGTSFASPLVAGAIAVARNNGASSGNLAMQSVLISADKVASMQSSLRTDSYGTGRLNLSQALLALQSTHYSLSQDLAMKLICPGDLTTCSYAVTDYTGNAVTVTSKSPASTSGEFTYLVPHNGSISTGLKSLQVYGGQNNQPRTYITFDP